MSRKNLFSSAVLFAGLGLGTVQAFATPFTSTSLTGVDVTTVGASTVGGIVVDLYGINGAHVISQLAASSLYIGYAVSNPFTIGTQTGFDSTVTDALGGGLQGASFRFSLFDGDTGPSNFDRNDNTLLVNGINFGNWSTVVTQNTDGLGNLAAAGQNNSGGFRNNTLDTGWFGSTDTNILNSFYTSLVGTQQIAFQVNDRDPFDNYYDFTQGIDKSLINVGQGPVVTPPAAVPEPATLALLGMGLAGLGGVVRRRRKA